MSLLTFFGGSGYDKAVSDGQKLDEAYDNSGVNSRSAPWLSHHNGSTCFFGQIRMSGTISERFRIHYGTSIFYCRASDGNKGLIPLRLEPERNLYTRILSILEPISKIHFCCNDDISGCKPFTARRRYRASPPRASRFSLPDARRHRKAGRLASSENPAFRYESDF